MSALGRAGARAGAPLPSQLVCATGSRTAFLTQAPTRKRPRVSYDVVPPEALEYRALWLPDLAAVLREVFQPQVDVLRLEYVIFARFLDFGSYQADRRAYGSPDWGPDERDS